MSREQIFTSYMTKETQKAARLYSRDVRDAGRPDHMEGSTLGLYILGLDAGAINVITLKLM